MIINTEEPSFKREVLSHALLNTNVAAREDHLARRRNANEIDIMQKQIADMNETLQKLTRLIESR